MTAELYQVIVLDDFFPFMAASYNFDCTLYQDNVFFIFLNFSVRKS
jgi:hypothetical protein